MRMSEQIFQLAALYLIHAHRAKFVMLVIFRIKSVYNDFASL